MYHASYSDWNEIQNNVKQRQVLNINVAEEMGQYCSVQAA